MNRKQYKNTSLTCIFQNANPFENQTHSTLNSQPSTVLSGVISRSDKGFRFEEAVRKGRPKRNPKLFDGKFCSLVHMANGKYQIHMKTIDASGITDRQDLAFKVYSELLNAFNIID